MSTPQVSSDSQSVKSSLNPIQSNSDSWESRISAAATFMGVTKETIEAGLKRLGVEKEPAGLEMLSDESITPFGDIRSVFCDYSDGPQSPIAKVRMAMKYLRGPKGSDKIDTIDPELVALKAKYGIKMKMEDVDPSELLESYHPEQPNHPITTALRKRFGDKKVIVFKPDSKVVDIEATANYIADLEQGYAEEDTVESDGVLVRVYAVGQVPNKMVEEDPLFEGKPLKRGRSTVNRVNWENVATIVRQFCRVIVNRGDIDRNDRFHVQELMKVVSDCGREAGDAIKCISKLRKAYPEADLEYRELSQKNKLPKLTLSMEESNGKKQNPFGVNKNRNY